MQPLSAQISFFACCHFRHRELGKRARTISRQTETEGEQGSKKSSRNGGGKYWPKIALPSLPSTSTYSQSLDDGTDGRKEGRIEGEGAASFLPPEILRERSCGMGWRIILFPLRCPVRFLVTLPKQITCIMKLHRTLSRD